MSSSHDSRNFFLKGPAGRLEAILWTPFRSGRGHHLRRVCTRIRCSAVRWHNKVVYQVAKSPNALGYLCCDSIFAGRLARANTIGAGESRTTCEQRSIFFPEIFVRATIGGGLQFWLPVAGLRAGCEDARVSQLIGLGLQ